MHRTVAAALVAALALALASCGGSEKTQTVTRAELISRLESACLAGQRAAGRETSGKTGQRAFLTALLVYQKLVIDRVGTLETVGAAKADFDAYKDVVRSRLVVLERIAAASNGDLARSLRAAKPQLEALSTRAQVTFHRLGARHVCI